MAIIPTRADSFTSEKKKPEFFSDFLNSFSKTPFGNDLARVTNERDTNQYLKNMIYTNAGERMFNPLFGSNVLASMFEFSDTFQANQLEFLIKNTLDNFAKDRIILSGVKVKPDPDNDAMEVSIIYYPINSPTEVTFDFLLKRIR